MLDCSGGFVRTQLINPGSYDCRPRPGFLALSWELNVPGRDLAIIEEVTYVEVESGAGDPAQASLGRALLKAIFQAHGIGPTFSSYNALMGAIIGCRMRVTLRRALRAGLPVAEIAGLLPVAAEDH